ncbi:hypothetical protein [Helicobacter sp. MIT 05-5294]|uniref:hypothetical protein n=1 Tax=Helicobacter sp. MIT 05-5294 TaxID=1548150 RepID=UPI00051FA4FC|nr:hypothetical protein [Helicobacter sp. MIT 05-5294]TLD85807.1 hypothetical protein LS69_007885 [Helicobacter sp. MIT 05-5294]
MEKDIGIIAIFYGIIISTLQTISAYLGVDYGVVKVFFWVYVFAICFGTLKTIVLRQSFQEFLIRNWLLKTMLLIIPTLVALEASIIPFLGEFVDWFFYYFILAETSYILSCILSIHKRKDVTTSFSVGGLEIILDKLAEAIENLIRKIDGNSNDTKDR